MTASVIVGLLIPFVGTTLGSAVVFFMKRSLSVNVSRALTGFAAGVMTAASVWSLIIPAIEQSEPKQPRINPNPVLTGRFSPALC